MRRACICSTFPSNTLTLFAYDVICHGFVIIFFQNKFVCFSLFFFLKNLSRISVECQAVWIKIIPCVFLLVLGPSYLQGYQQLTLVSKEFMTTIQAN